jgi:hypothetical protein
MANREEEDARQRRRMNNDREKTGNPWAPAPPGSAPAAQPKPPTPQELARERDRQNLEQVRERRKRNRENAQTRRQRRGAPPSDPQAIARPGSIAQQNYWAQQPEALYWDLQRTAGAPIDAATAYGQHLRDEFANHQQTYQGMLPNNPGWTSMQNYFEQQYGPNQYSIAPGTNPYTGQPANQQNQRNRPTGLTPNLKKRQQGLGNLPAAQRPAARTDLQQDIRTMQQNRQQNLTRAGRRDRRNHRRSLLSAPPTAPVNPTGLATMIDQDRRKFLNKDYMSRGENPNLYGGGPVRWSVF